MTRAILMLTLTLAACGDDHAEEESCGHLTEGAAREVTASPSPAGAPAITAGHQRWQVALPQGAVGHLSLASDAAGPYDLLLDADVPLKVRAPGGAELTRAEGPACAAAPVRARYTLAVGTHLLELGPSAAARVGLVVERGHEH